MKKTRQRLFFLAVLLLIGTGVFVGFKKVPALFVKNTQAFPGLIRDKIKKLVITIDKNQVEIAAKNNRWRVGVFPADTERVENIITGLASLQKEDVVSTNKDKHTLFEVDGKRTIRFDNHLVYVGASIGLSQIYIRLDNDPFVYSVSSDLADLLSPADFRDLKPTLVREEEKVDRVELVWPKHELRAVKKKMDWFLASGKKAKKERIDFWLNDIKTLKGTDLFEKKTINLTIYPVDFSLIVAENGQEKKGIFYLKDKETLYLAQEGSPFVYQIPRAYASGLKKEEKDLTE